MQPPFPFSRNSGMLNHSVSLVANEIMSILKDASRGQEFTISIFAWVGVPILVAKWHVVLL